MERLKEKSRQGRKTAAERASIEQVLAAMGVPPAPPLLTGRAKAEWEDIVSHYPADRFPRATWPMLVGYCTHTALQEQFIRALSALDPEEDGYMRKLRDLRAWLEAETKLIASLGVRLGIARTSMAGRHNNDPDDTRNSPADPDPWERPQSLGRG